MTASIVHQLGYWLEARRERLAQARIEVDDRLPRAFSNAPWKGSIGLTKDNILVSFTVWELTTFQAELIVVDGNSQETLQSIDFSPQRPSKIESVLDEVVTKLAYGAYRRLDR